MIHEYPKCSMLTIWPESKSVFIVGAWPNYSHKYWSTAVQKEPNRWRWRNDIISCRVPSESVWRTLFLPDILWRSSALDAIYAPYSGHIKPYNGSDVCKLCPWLSLMLPVYGKLWFLPRLASFRTEPCTVARATKANRKGPLNWSICTIKRQTRRFCRSLR